MPTSEFSQILQRSALYVIRGLGGFSIARHLTRKRLRILCFHGFSFGDEFRFLPLMFMRAQTFERRMRILKKWQVPVIRLDEAVRRLRANTITSGEAVITFDDGWASNLTIGLPILVRYGYPACIYVTTEHLTAGVQAFNVALYYMLSRSRCTTLTLSGVHPALDGLYDIGTDPGPTVTRLITAAERACSLAERQELLEPIASALGLNFTEVFSNGRLSLLSAQQLIELAALGVDIELHTHTHRLSHENFEVMALEISRNREQLAALIGRDARHFCYPSGQYRALHGEWLERLGIASGTTCDPGLNDGQTSHMFLKRYLDSELTPDIVFEAEICGLRELLRRLRTAISGNVCRGEAATLEVSQHRSKEHHGNTTHETPAP